MLELNKCKFCGTEPRVFNSATIPSRQYAECPNSTTNGKNCLNTEIVFVEDWNRLSLVTIIQGAVLRLNDEVVMLRKEIKVLKGII
jgi:hypothetical protein